MLRSGGCACLIILSISRSSEAHVSNGFQMHANNRARKYKGSFCGRYLAAAVGYEVCNTGDTLCDMSDVVAYWSVWNFQSL